MIPFIRIADLHLFGPVTLHPFGLLVATGVIIGTALATRRARQRGFDLDKLNSFITWMLVAGFLGGHMLDEIFYHPAELVSRPWSLFLLWEGLSSFGGFTGALVGIVLWKYFEARTVFTLGPLTFFTLKRRAQAQPILPFADLILSVFPVAWVFGRSGCSVVHDHPGARAPADALFAVAYGDGPVTHFGPLVEVKSESGRIGKEYLVQFVHGSAPQWDLGTLELLFTIVLAALVALTWSRRLSTGTYVYVTSLAYAPVRFAMDFLRIRDGQHADPRYASLTPAQWECIALFALGVVMFLYVRKLARSGDDPARLVMAPPQEPEPSAVDQPPSTRAA
jgi:phosphatidylglycerol---prolipoprotein diacylglyceryl transferase